MIEHLNPRERDEEVFVDACPEGSVGWFPVYIVEASRVLAIDSECEIGRGGP
jgi:hypothetical protein